MRHKLFILFLLCLVAGSFGFVRVASAQNAILYFSPATGTFAPGQNLWVTVMAHTRGETVRSATVSFSYPQDKLEPIRVDTAQSILTIFSKQNATQGRVEISGTATPGFSGIYEIASVGFAVKSSSGGVTLAFDSQSALSKDSGGKNILTLASSGNGEYKLQAEPSLGTLPETLPRFPLGALPQLSTQEPLVISNVAVKKISADSVLVSWNTNRLADSRIDYGAASDYDFSVRDGTLATSHELTLSDLTPSADYHVKITSADASQKSTTTGDRTLNDLQAQDKTREAESKASQTSLFLVILAAAILIGIFLVSIFFVVRKLRERRRLR